jgi:hypothetical protein
VDSRIAARASAMVVAVALLLVLLLALRVFLGPAGTQKSVDRNVVVRACGREVLAEYRDLPEYPALAREMARGMRKDCGIYAD